MTTLTPHASGTPLATGTRDDEAHRSSRRSFLRKGACAAGIASTLALRPQLAFATPSNPATGDAVVIVYLRGGADGLSMTPPINGAFDSYAAIRPTIAITPDQALPLDSSNPNVVFPQGLDGVVGLHPAMFPLYESVWANGNMAIIPASGMPDAETTTRSHFEMQAFSERGSAASSIRTGFLARVSAALNANGPVSTVSTSSTSAEILRGGRQSFSVGNLDGFGVNGFTNRGRATTALQAMSAGTGFVNTTAAATVGVAGTLAALDVDTESFPNTNTGRDLRDVAVMLKANIGLRAAIVNSNGWDHHNELGTSSEGNFFNRTTELAQALRGLIDSLGPDGLNETTIVVISEFGRTVDENGNGGTDHGRAGTTMIIGGGIQGGVFGYDYPDVVAEDPDARRAFRVLTDYRQGIDEVLNARVGVSGIFPTMAPAAAPLGVVRA